MRRLLAPAALVVALAQCGPSCTSSTNSDLPPGATVGADGCINLDAVPKDGRLDYANHEWRWNTRLFATSEEEDSCARQVRI